MHGSRHAWHVARNALTYGELTHEPIGFKYWDICRTWHPVIVCKRPENADLHGQVMRFIHPNNLHDVWDLVREGLTRIHDRSSDRWKIEDVYWQLKNNGYTLHVCDGNKGFAILQTVIGWDGPEVFVFCAYVVPGEKVIDEAFAEIKDMARSINAKRIKFQSMRKGWGKRAEQLGYKPGYQEYELELDYKENTL